MWNNYLIGLLLCTSLCCGDVSHLQHHGYPTHKPHNPLELPGEGTTNTGAIGYPSVVPENPLQIPQASTGNVQNQVPDGQPQGTSDSGSIAIQQQDHHHDDHTHDDHHHHYHGEDGKYNPHDDGRGWDIRKSVPGEPGQDYPTYASVPTTGFTCREKSPGYYADEEAGCQVFRICTTNSLKTHNSFLCPNGSLFSQEFLTCDWWMNVDCTSSSQYYYKNQEIGKMPTGQQLMKEVNKMLEAPNKNPYYFTQQQQQFLDQMIQDNQIQGTGPTQELYIPPKVQTTTKKYYSPTVPVTTTTFRPTISTSSVNKVQTQDQTVNQQTVNNQYIPPKQTIDETSFSNVNNQFQVGDNTHVSSMLHESSLTNTSLTQKKKQDNLYVSPILSKPLQKETKEPPLFISQIKPINNIQPLYLSEEARKNNTKLFTSEIKPTNNNQPLFVSKIAMKQSNPSTDSPLFLSKLTPENNSPLFVSPIEDKPFVSKVAMKTSNPFNEKLYISPEKPTNQIKSSQTEKPFLSQINQATQSGQTGFEQKQVDQTTGNQVTNQINQQVPSVTVTKEKTHTVTHSEKTTHVFQHLEDGPEKISLLDNNKNDVSSTPKYSSYYNSELVNKKFNEQQGQSGLNVNQQKQQGFDQSVITNIQNTQTGANANQQKQGQFGVDQSIFTNVQNKQQQHLGSVNQNKQQGQVGIDQSVFTNVQNKQQHTGYPPYKPQIQQQSVNQNKQQGQVGIDQSVFTNVQNKQHTGYPQYKPQVQQQSVYQNKQQGQLGIDQIEFTNVQNKQQQQLLGQTGINQQKQQGFQNVQQQGQTGFKFNQPAQQGFDQSLFSNVQNYNQNRQQGQQLGGVVDLNQFNNQQGQFGFDQSLLTNVQTKQNFDVNQQFGFNQGTQGFELSKEQAFAQIDNIQKEFQQSNLQNFGVGVLNPRQGETIPVPNFGKNIGFSEQGVQPIPLQHFPQNTYIQNQGFQPGFLEQNVQNFNFHGKNLGDNFNVEVFKDGLAHNFKGENIAHHTNGQTHSKYSGHNVLYKESTKVDIVPAIGFHLNDNVEKNSYISAVLSGLVQDSPNFQNSASNNFPQTQFLPSDVRYSSYNGPSSYLAPQKSVQNLPSDAGYHHR